MRRHLRQLDDRGRDRDKPGRPDFELDQFGKTTYELPGYGGGHFDTNAVTTFVQGNNTPGGGSAPSGFVTDDTTDGGAGFMGGSSCPAPS